MSNEDELAAVLAHECAHVVARRVIPMCAACMICVALGYGGGRTFGCAHVRWRGDHDEQGL